MGGLRGKLLVTLIVYFAGFASAIYYQAPALDDTEIIRRQASVDKPSSEETVSTKAEVIARKVHADLLEYYSIAEEKASKVGALIKARLDKQ